MQWRRTHSTSHRVLCVLTNIFNVDPLPQRGSSCLTVFLVACGCHILRFRVSTHGRSERNRDHSSVKDSSFVYLSSSRLYRPSLHCMIALHVDLRGWGSPQATMHVYQTAGTPISRASSRTTQHVLRPMRGGFRSVWSCMQVVAITAAATRLRAHCLLAIGPNSSPQHIA